MAAINFSNDRRTPLGAKLNKQASSL